MGAILPPGPASRIRSRFDAVRRPHPGTRLMQRLQLGAPDFTCVMLSCLHNSIRLIGDQNSCKHWSNCNHCQEKGDAHVSRVIWKKEMHMCLGLSVEVWKLEILMGTRPELSLWKSAGTEGAETFAVCRMWTGSNCKNCSFFWTAAFLLSNTALSMF